MLQFARCPTCKGAKVLNGMGGVINECWNCEGQGRVEAQPSILVEKQEVTPEPIIAASEVVIEPDKKKENDPVVAKTPNTSPKVQAEQPIFEGYSNSIMRALFEENKMTYTQWEAKHKHNPELFAIRIENLGFGQTKEFVSCLLKPEDRRAIIELYAMSQPIAERKINMMSSQDNAAMKDPSFRKMVKQGERKQTQNGAKIILPGGM